MGGKDTTDVSEEPEASKFRTILPQVLASTAKNFLLLDLGMAVAFPTIVIPALRGTVIHENYIETLHFTSEQASWFGSIAFICQPIGSVLSGLVTEPLGRKKSMILVNIPHIIGWIMLYLANSLTEMYIAATLLGLGVGFMEAPIVTYVGEICQPSIRGILTSCAGVAATLGFFIVYLLGIVTSWRIAAAICLSVPLSTIIAICFVPETPLWLLSKNRSEEALKSLQWLRGWVSAKAVDKEFNEMKRYSENSNKCIPCQKSQIKCLHSKPSGFEKLKELQRKRTLKPFILVIVFFAFFQFSGLTAMRPYLVQIFSAYRVPVDPSWGTAITGLMGFIANIFCMVLVKFVGKRIISLFSMFGTAISFMLLGIYGYNNLPPTISSFDIIDASSIHVETSYIPLILIFCISFCASMGIVPVPWMLLSEVFPFKTRGVASGITAALNYIMAFITTKTYLNLEKHLYLYGVAFFYGSVGCIGFIYLYMFLPETERRTLEDIETHFSDNNRKLADRKIKKNVNLDFMLNDKPAVITNIKTETEQIPDTDNTTKKDNETEQRTGCDNKAYTES